MNKKQYKILEAIWEILVKSDFEDDGRKYLDKFMRNKNMEISKDNNTIVFQNRAGTKTLYTITIS